MVKVPLWVSAGASGAAAVAEVFLEDGEFATVDVEAIEGDRVIVVVDLQHQVGGAGIAIGIGQRVGEGFRATATAVQRFEIGIAGVQRVGVSAVGIEHQGAVGPGEGAANDRAAVGANRNAVCALRVVRQHTAGQGQQGFRCGIGVAVIDGLGHVVSDIDVQRAGDGVTVAVAGHHGELLDEGGGAVARRMDDASVEGKAVAHHASGRVVRDGQGVALWRSDRLGNARGHTTGDDVDAADAQAVQPVQRRHTERAVLCQRARITRRTVGQVGFVEGQFPARDRQADERDRIVDGRWRGQLRRPECRRRSGYRRCAVLREIPGCRQTLPSGSQSSDRPARPLLPA